MRSAARARPAVPPPRAARGLVPRARLPADAAARLRADHLVRGSLYLIAGSALQAGFGCVFWIAAARLFPRADLGLAGSLISATTVIAYLALLGLNNTLAHRLPAAADRGPLISSALLISAAAAAAAACGYLLAVPALAPRLAFAARQPVLAAGFVLLTAAAAVNLLTDSVFVGARAAVWVTVTDGLVGGPVKLAAVFAGTGAFGIYAAAGGGQAAAAAASLAAAAVVLRWRPRSTRPLRVLRPALRFAGASYAANAANLVPVLAVPLVVLDRLGAPLAACYFVAFQIATLLYSVVYAVEQVLLAEGGHAGSDQRRLRRRSLVLLAALALPAGLLLTVLAGPVLTVFGPGYRQHAAAALAVLAAGVLPAGAVSWLQTMLRLAGRLRRLVASSAVYAAAVCGLAAALAPHGLTAVAAAWPLGGLAGAAAALAPGRRRRQPVTPAAAGPIHQQRGAPGPRPPGGRRLRGQPGGRGAGQGGRP